MQMDVCLQCGLCIEVCPVEQSGASSFLTRLTGDPASEMSTWLCTSCWLCQATCPYDVDVHSLIMLARRDSPPAPVYAGGYTNVQRTGFALPLPHDLNAIRADYGLPPVALPDPETLRHLLGDPRDR